MPSDMSRAPTSPDADFTLYLHAELLPNIRQITLYVSLPRSSAFDGVQPQLELSESRKSVIVSLTEPFHHVAETIKLPARVGDAARRILKPNAGPLSASKPTVNNHDYSFRMPIDADDESLAPRDELIDEYVPWTAADMSSATRIRCRACGTALLKNPTRDSAPRDGDRAVSNGWTWKDLPSGNWAEMMDFWHCHKPDPHEHNPDTETNAALRVEEANAQVKGYGASSQVEATPGSVFIDVATFLLAEPDCAGLRKVWIPHPMFLILFFAIVFWLEYVPLIIGQLRRRPFLFNGMVFDTIALYQHLHITVAGILRCCFTSASRLKGSYPLLADGFRSCADELVCSRCHTMAILLVHPFLLQRQSWIFKSIQTSGSGMKQIRYIHAHR